MAQKNYFKAGHVIHTVSVDVGDALEKGENKLKNTVTAAAHHVTQTVVQAAKGAVDSIKDEVEPKLAVHVAKVAHMAHEVRDVIKKGKKIVQNIEDAPEKIKQKFNEDVNYAKGR